MMTHPVSLLPEHLAGKIETQGSDCWLWQASLRDGYGQFWWGGSNRGAHIVVYELLVGPVPDGLELDHLCRVRSCVNPDHLEPVTHRENVLRSPTAFSAVNARKTHCPRGHSYRGRNLRRARGGRQRTCRACQKIHNQAYKIRHAG